MSRLLFIGLIFVMIYWLLKSYFGRVGKNRATGDASVQAEDMVRCAHCGVHLPKHESTLAGVDYFCSEAHRRAHTERPDQS